MRLMFSLLLQGHRWFLLWFESVSVLGGFHMEIKTKTEQDVSGSTAEQKEEQMQFKIRKENRENHFLSSCNCWLEELTFKAWVVKKYSNICFCKACCKLLNTDKAKSSYPLWQLDSVYKITRLFQTITGVLPVTLLPKTVKKEAAQNLPLKTIICLTLFLESSLSSDLGRRWLLLRLWLLLLSFPAVRSVPTARLGKISEDGLRRPRCWMWPLPTYCLNNWVEGWEVEVEISKPFQLCQDIR